MVHTKFCFLCFKSVDIKKFALHKFPREPMARSAWMKICRLNETDDVSKLKICSQHFTAADYVEPQARELGSHLYLKPGAFPSIRRPTKFAYSVHEDRVAVGTPVPPSMPPSQDEYYVSSTKKIKLTPKADTASTSKIEVLQETPNSSSKGAPQYFSTPSSTPKKRLFSEPRYVNEVRSPHLNSPRSAKRCFNMAKRELTLKTEKIKRLQRQKRTLLKRVANLWQLLNHLKNKNLLSDSSVQSLMGTLPECLQEIVRHKLKKRTDRKYSPELRRFALTLQFYSTAAYDYVRKTWQNLLPHTSTLRKWYTVVDGKPGFTKESFGALQNRNQYSPVILNLVMDEMSIRTQIIYQNGQFYGGVNMGTELENESDAIIDAKNALVFMAVGLNGHWKIPVGYFLIDGLGAAERANLLVKCLELIADTGAKVSSLTFDGASVNLAMCTSLGAKFDYYSPNFQPWFLNPNNNTPNFCLLGCMPHDKVSSQLPG